MLTLSVHTEQTLEDKVLAHVGTFIAVIVLSAPHLSLLRLCAENSPHHLAATPHNGIRSRRRPSFCFASESR